MSYWTHFRKSKFKWIFSASAIMTVGLVGSAFLTFRFPDAGTRYAFLGLIGLLLLLNVFLIVYLMLQIYRPIQLLIKETEETLQGMRHGDISLVRDDELGQLANSFNQIILDAQMKRMELETSNVELASHAEIIEKTYRELDKKVYDLFTLFNIGKELNSTLSMESILKITCFTCMGQLGITVMTIMLLENRDDTKMSTVFEKGLRGNAERAQALVCSGEFMNMLRMSEQPLLLSDLDGKREFQPELAFFTDHKCFMIIPLTVKKNIIGIMLMGKKLSGEGFTQGEKDFVNTLGSLTAIALENARLYELAITDAMTKLFLKRYFQLRLDDEFKRVERYRGKIALAMIDIDHFKRINDTYGHTKGDEVLISVAKAIKDNFRDVDIPARYGGEEFSVIMPEVSKEDALIAAERLRKTVEATPHEINGKNVVITISIGLAEAPRDAENPLALIEAADAALYRSKENGRNRSTLA
jgi:diguanylate cyclase (GGDEF)-like protein